MTASDADTGDRRTPLFYVVDWLPPDFGAVGQYASIAARNLAVDGRDVFLIGLTRGKPSTEVIRLGDGGAGSLTIIKLHAEPYEKSRLLRRLLWTLGTDMRLIRTVVRHPASCSADLVYTGAPPFMIFFAFFFHLVQHGRLTYRITDFYPEAIIAHLGRRPLLLRLIERFTWFLRRRVDRFEVLGEDQRTLLLRGGVRAERITVKRDTSPVAINGNETPAPRPPQLMGHKILLYSGNYGVAHDVDTVIAGLVQHHRDGSGRFALWLNATGRNADLAEQRLTAMGVPVARTRPVPLHELPSLLAAADVHLIALRAAFAGIVFPSKVYGCIQSKRPILFVGPAESDVHLLCTQAGGHYRRVEPGDAADFARALDELSGAIASNQ